METGIADAAVLLSFGENGWSEDLVRREDAAGMGFLSLARRGCAVSSRPRVLNRDPAAGWRVELAPDHFLGEAKAAVDAADAAPFPHGTAVAFDATPNESPMAIRSALESAARHYPLPVFFEHAPNTPPGGQVLPRKAFLDGAVHVERWRGLVFGVFPDRVRRRGFNEPDVNFHGLTVKVRLPEVGTVHGGTWYAAADVEDCPELQFVLPARKEAVETPFLAEMREAARLGDLSRARRRPGSASGIRGLEAGEGHRNRNRAAAPGAAALAARHRRRRRLARAAQARIRRQRRADRGLRSRAARGTVRVARGRTKRYRPTASTCPTGGLQGYAWYDAIPRIADIRTDVTAEGRTRTLDDFAPRGPTCEPSRPIALNGPRRSASACSFVRTRGRRPSSTCRAMSRSRARPGPARTTPSRW